MEQSKKDFILRVAKAAVSVDGLRLGKCVLEDHEENLRWGKEAQTEFVSEDQRRQRESVRELFMQRGFADYAMPPLTEAESQAVVKQTLLVAKVLEGLGAAIHPLEWTVSTLASSSLLSAAGEHGLNPEEVANTVLMWIAEQSAAQIADMLLGGQRDELMMAEPEAVKDWEVTIEPIDDVLREEMGVRKRKF